MTQIERAFVLLFSDSMSDLAVNLASAKLNAALGRLSTIQTITTEEVDEAIEQIITEMAWEKTMEALQGGATRLLQAQIIKGGGISANIPKSIATRFAFDAVDDRAVLWAEAQAGALIREIDDETRTAIKKIVVDSLKGGYSGDDAAEMVSRIIGLNTRQTLAVENLYQNTVKSLTEDGVSARQARSRAKKMAAEYRERLIEYRGKMIARTEIMRAANNGRLLSWAQALDDGLIASTMLKEWRTYPGFGARGPCPICLELRGTTVEIFSEFPNGSMMPPAHPFCRCTSVLVPPTRGTTRTAQVGGGYVGPIDPIGAVLSQEVDSTVEKANPYHDPRTGRFTFAPANDMGGGGGALTPMGEREAFAARIRQAREDLGEIDYGLTSESILDETAEARTLQKQIEFGHIVRTEIDRRMAAAVSTPEHSARVEELKRAEELVHDEMGRLIARKETMFAERERRRMAVVEAEQAMNEARDTSPDYNRVKARYDEVRAKRDTASHEFRAERDRLGDEYDAANPQPEGMSLWEHMERRDTWRKDQPSYQRAYDQHTLYRDEADKWKRYLDEVDFNGVTPHYLNGADGPGSRTPLKVSDDNPLKRDPFLMKALDAQTAARKSLKEYDADSYADQMNALWEKKRAAESASNAFSGQTRRRIIKETLEDAGVEFSDGRVVFYSSSRDSDFESGSIIMLGQKRSKAVRSIEEVAPYIPKEWAQDIQIAAKERGRMALTIKFDRNKRGEFGNFEIVTDGNNTSLHELMHAVEASTDRVPRFEKAFYRYRTRGETAVRLKDLRPKARYRADEMTKPDKFYSPYVGKIYDGRYHELLTMTYADMMYQRGEDGFKKLDPELQAWLWSTLILA